MRYGEEFSSKPGDVRHENRSLERGIMVFGPIRTKGTRPGTFAEPVARDDTREEVPELIFPNETFSFERGAWQRSHWSIPWSDLMMTMFILFAVMYVYGSSSREVFSSRKKEFVPNIRTVYDISKQMLKGSGLNAVTTVELVPNKAVRILLTGDLLFDPGQADVKPRAKDLLQRIAAILRKTPYSVNLVGHTDDVPIHTDHFPSNWELSTARACAVARFLIKEMNVPANRFSISGRAFYQPLRPNDSAGNRAINRRVEVIIARESPPGNIQDM